MHYEALHLKQLYEFPGTAHGDPVLELYLPYNMSEMNRQDQKRPCLVICPGGGYSMCSQRESEVIALQYLSDGFNVFVLTYSVSPHRYPAQLQEVAAALDLIHRNASQWNCDVSRVALMGFSAGAHLAAHYANSFDDPAVRAIFPDSHPVQASLLCYPVITADALYAHAGSFENLTGLDFQRDAEKLQAFSCEKLVSPRTPPAFLWHTSLDTCVPVVNSLLYAAALARQNIPFELHVYPYGGHGLATVDGQTCDQLDDGAAYAHRWIEESRRWLQLVF